MNQLDYSKVPAHLKGDVGKTESILRCLGYSRVGFTNKLGGSLKCGPMNFEFYGVPDYQTRICEAMMLEATPESIDAFLKDGTITKQVKAEAELIEKMIDVISAEIEADEGAA